MTLAYRYDAHCTRVVDGDTFDVVVDLGFNIRHAVRVRLNGIDTHEIYGVARESDEYQQGHAEAEWVRAWFETARLDHDGRQPLIVTTYKDATGKYGRYIADIERKSDGENLASALVAAFGAEVRG